MGNEWIRMGTTDEAVMWEVHLHTLANTGVNIFEQLCNAGIDVTAEIEAKIAAAVEESYRMMWARMEAA